MLERLTDDPMTLNFGVVAMTFSEKEEQVLDEPVSVSEIQIKPSGQPYLSHPSYTKRFNRAFGRGQWHMRPLSKPAKAGNTVMVPYALMVRGVPVATAYGEQDYYESNREQTYGDALESTVASALRRCAKRLGVTLEMWSREFLNDFIDKYAVVVRVTTKDGGFKKQWRLKSDPPFWNETGKARLNDGDSDEAQRQQTKRPTQARAERPAATNPKDGMPISSDQAVRFWTIARRAGRSDEEIKTFLKKHYNLDSSKLILRKDYDSVVRAVEHPGPMMPVLDVDRQPGEDD